MKKDFRPSIIQMNYLDEDLMIKMQEQGIIREDEYTTITGIDWYDWDNDGRWFVHASIYNELGEKRGYVEVDVWVYSWNGDENPMGIEKVEIAGHGWPCSGVSVVNIDKETDDWIILD